MKGRTKLAFIQDEIKAFAFNRLAKSFVKKESYFLSSYKSNAILDTHFHYLYRKGDIKGMISHGNIDKSSFEISPNLSLSPKQG